MAILDDITRLPAARSQPTSIASKKLLGEVSESTLALEAIREAGHGGHFFATTHTMANYTTAFYEPLVSDWSNFETWAENGEKTAYQRANKVYRQRLKEYSQPEIDPRVKVSLDKYVIERRREIEGQP